MNKIKLGLAIIAVAALASTVFAGDGEATEHFKAGDWTVGVHLKSIPEEYRDMVKATHHLSVMVMKPDNSHIEDGKVTYRFTKGKEVVASGEAKFMGGMGHDGSGNKKDMGGSDSKHEMPGGHYGADVNLPGPGEYALQITVEASGEIRKASGKITVP